MSYTRTLHRRTRIARKAMSGLSSQPRGMPVARHALTPMSGLSSLPPGRRISNAALGIFGDTDPTQIATPTVGTPQWASDMVASQQEMTAWQARWVKNDEMQRWIQIAATLSIPLAAAIWRRLGLGRKGLRRETPPHP